MGASESMVSRDGSCSEAKDVAACDGDIDGGDKHTHAGATQHSANLVFVKLPRRFGATYIGNVLCKH